MRLGGVLLGRWRLARNGLGGGRRGRSRRGSLLGIVLLVGLGAMVYAGLRALFQALAGAGAGPEAAAHVLGLALAAAVVGLLVFDLHEAVSTLLLDSDLELLRRAPVRPAALLGLKLLDALPRTSSLLAVLAIPAVAAYAASYPLPRWAWAALPAGLVALWLVPLGIGVAGAVHLLRIVPARVAREALGLFSTLTLTLLWIVNAFLLPRLVDPEMPFTGALEEALERGVAGEASPGHWLGQSIGAAASGDPAAAARAALPLAGTAALAIGIAVWTAARHLEDAQARAGTPTGKRARVGRARRAPGSRPRGLVRAVLARDARLFMRDWTVLGDVVTAAALWTLIPAVGAPLYPASAAALSRAMLLALTVGLGYEVAARSIPFERDGLAWVRVAPVRVGRWMVAKLVGAYALSLPLMLTAGIALAVAFRLPAREWVETACLVVPALAMSVALGLWTGTAFGDPKWTNPRAMLSLTGRLFASLLLLLQAGAWLGLSAMAHATEGRLPAGILYYGPAAIALLLSLLPMRAAIRRVERLEWSY